jgi:uncharacterized protein (TIGR02145 family)
MKTILFLLFSTLSISAFSQILQNVNKSIGTVSKPITQIDSIRFNTVTNQMEIIQTNGNAENHTISDVINVTFSGQLLGTISTLDCGSASNTGTLTAYTAASGASSTISYTGGNGGVYNGQTVVSTGVTGLTATLTAGTFAEGAGTLTYNITGTPNSSGTASFALNVGGKTCTLPWTVVLPVGVVSALNCGNATNTGTLIDGTAASGVSSSIPYSGGNGGTHNGQTVTSTGVTGLTATLNPGAFAVGSGTLTYTISGTPNSSGTASFLLEIGGKTCTLTLNVELPAGTIAVLDCANTTNTGTLIAYSAASGVSSSIPYSGGNGGTYSSQSIPSTGVTGLTANLTAGILTNGNGTLIYTITGTPNSGGTANFLINIDGQTCSINYNVNLPNAIITDWLDCLGATITGSLQAYSPANGVSSSVPYSGGNGGTFTTQIVPSEGVTGLTATLTSGTLELGNGNLIFTITGTPNSGGWAVFYINIGGRDCDISFPVSLPSGTISSLDCGTATNSGTLIVSTSASGVSTSVPYSGGNGGAYTTQSVSSTGVTGLTATLNAGTLLIGSGNVIYNITGTPSTTGTASFAISLGGQNCIFTVTVNTLASQYAANSVFCAAGPTPIVNVTNPSTGKVWMDRNLGASQVATSSTDVNAYGDLYQWGRRADGHQCRNSGVTSTLSSVDQPLHSNFIVNNTSPYDWRSPQNGNLWQGVNGMNNPCPSGYRLPTASELDAERLSWLSNDINGAFASPLKFTTSGRKEYNTGIVGFLTAGYYWSSNLYLNGSSHLTVGTSANSGVITNGNFRAYGLSVRCIKN